MVPFPGESLALLDAAAGTDHGLATAIIKRGSYFTGSGATEATLTAGDEWRAWVSPGSATYLESAAEPVVVSWVLEVLSGTVTLTAGEGYDPGYGDDTLAPSSGLGTYTVTGPATLVIPSGFTAADVVTGADALMLHLAATSGSAVVQQVKLRVWPTGGALGGWSDLQPSWQTSPVDPGRWETSITMEAQATAAGAEAAWDASIAAFHTDADAKTPTQPRNFGAPYTGAVPTSNYATQGLSRNGLGDYTAGTTVVARLVMLLGDDWATRYPIADGLVDGVDFIRPPTEVQGDTAYFAQQEGAGSTGWQDATFTMYTTGDDVPGTVVLHSEAGTWANLSPGTGNNTYDVPVPTTGVYVDGAHSLPTGGLMIFLSVSHTIVTGASDTWPGWDPGPTFSASWTEDLLALLDAVKTYAVLPPYRVWSPTAGEPEPLQWSQRRDGQGMDGAPSWRASRDGTAGGRWYGRV